MLGIETPEARQAKWLAEQILELEEERDRACEQRNYEWELDQAERARIVEECEKQVDELTRAFCKATREKEAAEQVARSLEGQHNLCVSII